MLTQPSRSGAFPVAVVAKATRSTRRQAKLSDRDGPTPERLANTHVRSEEVRIAPLQPTVTARRVVGVVGYLYARGDLGDAENAAAMRWYRDYATGVLGGRDPVEGYSGQADAHDVMLARADAVGRCRAVREALQRCGEERLVMLMIDELTLAAMAQRLLPGQADGQRAVKGQIRLLLEQLAEHYRDVDRARRLAARSQECVADCTGTP